MPSRKSKYRNKWIVIGITVICSLGMMIEMSYFNYYAFSEKIPKDERWSRLIGVRIFSLYCSFSFNFVTIILLCYTIWLLFNTKATVEDPGHLNTTQLWILLVFYLLYMATNAMRLRERDYGDFTLYSEISHWTFLFMVMAVDTYILTNFEMSHFQLCTVANADHSVSIIGVGINGQQLFKFKIKDEIMLGHKEHLPKLEVFLKADKSPNR